ncbi:hypothetical protein QTP88_009065 [Uroleucon formosanum]
MSDSGDFITMADLVRLVGNRSKATNRMRSVLILCVTIAAAVACPINEDCSCNLPEVCPPTFQIKKFDSQYATLAFQGTWYLQMTTPTYIDQNCPISTGLFCNSFPCTENRLIFKDTTPCDDGDYNIEYNVIDTSYNIYTQCEETHKAILYPAYGSCSQYAIFNVGTPNYYKTTIVQKNPFNDYKTLYRHKIVKDVCDREYTIAVIGADDCWAEYMVLAVINQYENFFGGNEYILWVLTREVNPDWSTYDKAYQDIIRSSLSPNYLVSVDHSLLEPSMPGPSMPGSSITTPSIAPIISGDVDTLVKKTSVSTSTTKSISNDCGDTVISTTSSTTKTSTVIIDRSSDFSSLYDIAQCDLFQPYEGLQILKELEKEAIRRALSGTYYMNQATPCSFNDCPEAKVGLLNTCFPGGGMQLCFDDTSIDDWDCISPRMVMDRGYNMRTGDLHMTRNYITPVYSEDHPFSSTLYAFHSEGYYDKPIDEYDSLPLDGIICKPPSDIYKNQIIASIIGLKDQEYIIFCIANRYKNPLFPKKQVPLVLCYTRQRIPPLSTMKSIAQELLRCGINPNYMMKIDHTKNIETPYTFDKLFYESPVPCMPRGLSAGYDSPIPGLPSICPREWKVKSFDSQCATVAFQGLWYLQLATPTYINGNNPLSTGLFCNSYPCGQNQLIFRDTTPCDTLDFNTQYEMTDSSYNFNTQCREIQKALLCPAYGPDSKFAIFNVGSQKYYDTAIIEKYPFIDKNLYRHKIVKDVCDREYTVAVIGADDCWAEYMVLAVINQYENTFSGNEYILWVLTRKVNPDWCTYRKAYEDIERSCLSPNYLISVDHSLDLLSEPSIPGSPIPGHSIPESLIPGSSIPGPSIPGSLIPGSSIPGPSIPGSLIPGSSIPGPTIPGSSIPGSSIPGPSITTPSIAPIMSGDVDTLVKKTSVSTTSTTKSISNDYGDTVISSTSSTTQTSTVIIDRNSDFSSLYEIGPCDLFNNIQIYKQLEKEAIRRALSGTYYMNQATPTSYDTSPNSRVGLLRCGMQLCFDDTLIDDWDCISPRMVMDRGYNMRLGELQMTRNYITPVYSEDHPFSSTVYAFHSEGYYDKPIDEYDSLPLDGIICKPPSDIYQNQIIASIIGFKDNDYLIFCIANRYKNLLFKDQANQVIVYTRQRIPCKETLDSIAQELLRCGINPNFMFKVDQTLDIPDKYIFDSSYYESQTSCWSSTSSCTSISSSSTVISTSKSSSYISISS